jgi:hypothetical protein
MAKPMVRKSDGEGKKKSRIKDLCKKWMTYSISNPANFPPPLNDRHLIILTMQIVS